VLPLEDDVDERATAYLSALIRAVTEQPKGGSLVLPLNTTGDGSCMLNACSRGIWGVELFADLLRQDIVTEVRRDRRTYRGVGCALSCVLRSVVMEGEETARSLVVASGAKTLP
jgi:hypothetical protein